MNDTVPDSSLLVPYYCYLAAMPAGALAADGKPVEESIQTQLATAFNAQPQWENASCPTEAGPKVEWRKISATAPQPFIDQSNETKSLPAIFELYTKEIDDLRVFVGWCWPQKMSVNVSGVAPLTVGSIVAAPAQAAIPRLPTRCPREVVVPRRLGSPISRRLNRSCRWAPRQHLRRARRGRPFPGAGSRWSWWPARAEACSQTSSCALLGRR